MHESKLQIEWLFINLRWFFLTAVMAVIGINAVINDVPFPRTVIVLLIAGAAANTLALISLLQHGGNSAVQNLMLFLDIGLTLGFVASSGGTQSPLLFVSLIPIITAAVRLSWPLSAVLTVVVVLAYWGITWWHEGFSPTMPIADLMTQSMPYLTNGIVLMVAGLAVSQIGSRIKETLLKEQEKQEQNARAALESAHHRVQLIFELASTLSATLNYERVLDSALDVSNAGLQRFFIQEEEVTQIGLILLFDIDQSLYIAKARGIPLQDENERFPGEEGVLHRAIEDAEPCRTDDPGNDPELSRLLAMQNCQEALAVPLRAGFESYGLLVLASPEPDLYTPDYQELLIAICNQAVMALQNATLYQNLMEEKEKLVAVEEDARKRLARNLHDGPTQTIAAIAMRLNYTRMLINKQNSEEALKELQQLEDLARYTTKEIRQMLFILRPLILETQGLVPALRQLQKKIQETNPETKIHLEAEEDAARLLNKEAQGAIFYITEEALNNARKHAKADNLWIRIFKRGMNLITEIEDDGKGFDVAAVKSNYAERSSLGMLNLQERAKLVKGKTVIRSTPGQGTTITVTIPLDTDEETPLAP
ncbi:MAG: GAF domain-containing sensor histidine kinase [Anaerolineales bacterium]